MATPLIDITPILNTVIGLLGPLISLVITIQILKLVLSMVSGLTTSLGGGL
jgi:hypothetical protein